MTGAQAVAAALACEGVPCLFGVPGAQNNELWDASEGRRVPTCSSPTRARRASWPTPRRGRRATSAPSPSCPGPGLTNAMTGIGEALLRQRPDRRDHHRHRPLAPRAGRPGARAGQRRDRPPGRQGGDRGPPPGRDPRRDLPGVPRGRRRRAGAGRRGHPVPACSRRSGTTTSRRLPPTPCRSTRRPTAGRCHLADRKRRVGIYAGLGCVDAGPSLAAVAELLQAPVATSVSGKGCIPDAHPLAVGWGYGKQGTRAAEVGVQGRGPRAGGRRPLQRGLDRQLRDPAARDLIHVDINPQNLGRNVPTHVCVHAPTPVSSSTGSWPTARHPTSPLPRALAGHPEVAAGRSLRGADRPRPAVRRPDVPAGPVARRPRPGRAGVRRRHRRDALGLRGDRRPGPAPLLHAGRQPEHGLGDPGGHRCPARPARPPRRLHHRRRLLPDVGHRDVVGRPRRPAGQVLRASTTAPTTTCRCSRSRSTAGPPPPRSPASTTRRSPSPSG